MLCGWDEANADMRGFLWCCWHLGGSQSDVARLKAEDIDWQNQVVSFSVLKSAVSGLSVLANRLRKFCRDFLKPANCSRVLPQLMRNIGRVYFNWTAAGQGLAAYPKHPIASSDIGGTLIKKEGQKAANFK